MHSWYICIWTLILIKELAMFIQKLKSQFFFLLLDAFWFKKKKKDRLAVYEKQMKANPPNGEYLIIVSMLITYRNQNCQYPFWWKIAQRARQISSQSLTIWAVAMASSLTKVRTVTRGIYRRTWIISKVHTVSRGKFSCFISSRRIFLLGILFFFFFFRFLSLNV